MNRNETNGVRRQTDRNVTPSPATSTDLPPPSRLSSEEADIWREAVASVRPGWFQGSETVLETFCRAVAVERRLAGLLRAADADGYDEGARLAALARLHRGAAVTVTSIARALKLTAKATRDTSKQGSPLWEDDDEPETRPS